MSWSLENELNETVCVSQAWSGRDYTQLCGAEEGNYTLTCKDSDGDGWNGNYIEIKEQPYCKDFTNGYEHTVSVNIKGMVNDIKYSLYIIFLTEIAKYLWFI